jgi:hypothetical protein
MKQGLHPIPHRTAGALHPSPRGGAGHFFVQHDVRTMPRF